jgi:hypothetical protein
VRPEVGSVAQCSRPSSTVHGVNATDGIINIWSLHVKTRGVLSCQNMNTHYQQLHSRRPDSSTVWDLALVVHLTSIEKAEGF